MTTVFNRQQDTLYCVFILFVYLLRSHTLQLWSKLCSSKCIPLARLHKIMDLAVGRLQDKSSNVRKVPVIVRESMRKNIDV
jgi:hypothetical protein